MSMWHSDFSRANITMPPGSTLKETEAVVDRTAAVIAKDPNVERVFERINVGEGHVNIVLKKKRKLKSNEFERNLAPTLAAIPDARVSFQSNGGGPDADSRDIMLYLGGEDPAQLIAVANKIAKEMATVPGTFFCTSGRMMFWARSPILPSEVSWLSSTR